MIHICAECKKIRDEAGGWREIPADGGNVSGEDLSHGICPDCMQRLYHGIDDSSELTWMVYCREKDVFARVKVRQPAGATLDSLNEGEIRGCSIFSGNPISCGKHCLV